LRSPTPATIRRTPSRLSLAGYTPAELASVSPAKSYHHPRVAPGQHSARSAERNAGFSGAWQGSCRLAKRRSPSLAMGSGLGQFAVPLGEDHWLTAFQFVFGGHVPDRTVQTHRVVMPHVAGHEAPPILQPQRRPRPDALALERPVLPQAYWLRKNAPDALGHGKKPEKWLPQRGAALYNSRIWPGKVIWEMSD